MAIAAGWYHSLGVRSDGSIVAWGRNDYGQCDVPSPNQDFVAVAGGWPHSLGLKYMPPPTGACCIGDGCVTTNEYECTAAGGVYMGDDIDCADVDCPDPCPGDANGDGKVNIDDIFFILGNWGPCS